MSTLQAETTGTATSGDTRSRKRPRPEDENYAAWAHERNVRYRQQKKMVQALRRADDPHQVMAHCPPNLVIRARPAT